MKYRDGEYYTTRQRLDKRQELWVLVGESDEEWNKKAVVEYPPCVEEMVVDGETFYLHHVDDGPADFWLTQATYDPRLDFVKPLNHSEWKCPEEIAAHT